jgi:CRP/FNR family transcriptional regulator, nitrogen oxide reductase regulator
MPKSKIAIVSADWIPQFLDGLAAVDREKILAAASVRRFAARSVITNQGHPAEYLFLLTKGRARYFFDATGGQHILLLWVASGEAIGANVLLAKPGTYLVSTEAVRECSMLVWHRNSIRSFVAQYPILLENAFSAASEYLAWAVAAHVALSCHTAEQRLAGVLNSLSQVIGQKVPGGVELDVTNEELANSANVTQFTASRLLSAWQRQGFLKKGRGKLLVRKPAGMFLHGS